MMWVRMVGREVVKSGFWIHFEQQDLLMVELSCRIERKQGSLKGFSSSLNRAMG